MAKSLAVGLGNQAQAPKPPMTRGSPLLGLRFAWGNSGLHSLRRRPAGRLERLFRSSLVLLLIVWLPFGAAAQTAREIYYTGFEAADGYDLGTSLRGQRGWTGEGSGGNGLVEEFFGGYGQQAFVGFDPPAPKDDTLSLWRPLGVKAPAAGESILRFSVLMQIVDSTNGEYDDFRWSAYNTASQRLFSIDFDNSRGEINYALDDGNFLSSGFTFDNEAIYWLDVYMNFARNNWTALMNGAVVIDSQPLTTINALLDLSDVDAVWAIRKKGSPGDNYLLFDEYLITAEPGTTIAPQIEILGLNQTGEFELILHGERGLKYSVDASDDLRTWVSLGTNRLDNGFWQLTDTSAPSYSASFYRARETGP